MSDLVTFTFDGTSLNDGTTYMSFIPELDAMNDQEIGIVTGHHTRPSFGLPTPKERVMTCNMFIVPGSFSLNNAYVDFDTKLDTLKDLLDTSEGSKKVVIQRLGKAARYVYVHVRSFAVNRMERKVSFQMVAADPYWRANVGQTDIQTVTATGQSFALTNNGNKFALPKFTVKANTSNPNNFSYYRRVILKNTMRSHVGFGYMYDITGGGWDTATLIGASKMQADGDDLRVEFDGRDIPRYLDGINTATTKVWVAFPVPLQPLGSLGEGGEFVSNGLNYAPGTRSAPITPTSSTESGNNTAANAIATSWNEATGEPVIPNTAVSWMATTTSGWIKVNLGASKTINRVMILHLDGTNAASNYIVETSPNDSSWTTRSTVTGNTVQGKYTTHDFAADVACQYIRVTITTAQGGTRTGLNKIAIYNANYRLVLKYGNATAPAPGPWSSWMGLSNDPNATNLPSTSIAWKPLFDPTASTNYRHVYNASFRDTSTEGLGRMPGWSPISLEGNPYARTYNGTKDTYASPVSALGVSQVGYGTASGGADAWSIYETCGIFGINHTGNFKTNPTYYAWDLLSKTKNAPNYDQDWETPNVNTSGAWSYYSYQWTSYGAPDITNTKHWTVFRLKRLAYDPALSTSNTQHKAEVTQVTVQLVTANVPTVTLLAEIDTATAINWNATIKNSTNGDAISFGVSNFPSSTSLVIDCLTKSLTRADTGESLLSALSLNSPRVEWFRLDPGSNTIVWTEPGISNVTCTTTLEDRWT